MTVAPPAVPFVDVVADNDIIRAAIEDAMGAVVDSGRFVLGHELAAFEQEFGSYCAIEHCVGVASGTDALVLALRACEIGPGDEVITPSLTFFAGPVAIASVGALPVFVDVDEATATLDVNLVREAITPRTRAIMAVHLYGRCADLDVLAGVAEERGLWLIEDAAQAHGARWNGRAAGTVGHIGCFSFYPSKNLGAFGDGGAVVTGNPKLAERVRLLRNHGQSGKYRHELMGSNSRLDELQAAVLRRKLPYLDAWNAARRRAAEAYAELLDEALSPPGPDASDSHVFHLYVIRSRKRDELQRFLTSHSVETGIHYPLPIHRQPAFCSVRHVVGDLPVTDRLASEVLSLPMFPTISEEQIRYVIDRVHDGLAHLVAA